MRVGVWQVCLPLLALLASLAQGSVTCPKECKCTGTKVECPHFTLTLKDKHLDVRCNWRYDIYGSAYIKSYAFSDMAANSIKGLPFYDQLTFAKCAIPENRSLSDTLSMLGPLTNLKKLFFVENVDSAPLEPVLFEGLDSLEILSLKNVTQHPIEASDLFMNIPHLKWLDLRQYDGASLPADLLRPLQALTTLEYQQNAYIKELPPGWLSNLPQLDNCVIYGNGLTRLERFVGLPKLKKLSMRSNQLEELPEDLFSELPQLIELDIQRNRLTSLPDELFAELTQLEMLDLSHNKLPLIPDTLLQNQSQLRSLNLGYNQLTSLDGKVFENLKALKTLHLEFNQLERIDKNAFNAQEQTLSELDLSHNKLTFGDNVMYENGEALEGPYTPMNNLLKITTLDLSYNAIRKLFGGFDSFMPNLQTVDLSHNAIESLQFKQLDFLAKVSSLNLSNNRIRSVNVSNAPKKFPAQINLNNNPLRCDCNVHAFVHFLKNESRFVVNELRCDEPRVLKRTKVSEVSLSALECDYTESDCPAECACQIRPEDGVLTVDCSARNLTTVPMLHTPEDNKYRAFELRLEDNLLETLPDKAVMSAWEMVHRLNVSNNRLDALEVNNLPVQLQMLDVSSNRLRAFGEGVAQQLKHLQNVHLKANPWECTCGAEVLNFVQANSTRITDFEVMRCEDGETITMNLQNELCDNQWKVVAAICGIVAVFLAIAVVLVSFCYRYQHEVKVWLFTHNWLQWLTSEEELDKDKVYDAFVSYSHKDEEFITDFLVPKLESAPMNFRVCWHVRDFMPGEMISTQITKAVEDSRRTIIVLSANYLESVWGQMEFKTAYLQSIEDKRNRVIAIIYDDIGNVEDLDQELRAYLRTNTYLRWGDPWFWDKLRYAMPHPKRVKGMQINNNMRHHIATIDKLELIKTLQNGRAPAGDGDASPAQESTPPIEHVVKEIDGPLAKLYAPPAPTAPVFTISTAKLDLHAPE